MCWHLLCFYMLSMPYFGFVPLTFTVSVDSQIWGTGVIRPSHRLPHHSLNMTRVWWLSQQLRVMTALAPSLWSHLEFRLFSQMPFFSPSLLFWVSSSQRNSTIPVISASWHMTSALSQSIREAVGGGAGDCVTMAKMCVANQDKLFTAFAGLVEVQMIFLQYVMCVSIRCQTVSHKNRSEVFIPSQRVVKLDSCA